MQLIAIKTYHKYINKSSTAHRNTERSAMITDPTVSHAGRAKVGLGKPVVVLLAGVGPPAPTAAARGATCPAEELFGIPNFPFDTVTRLLLA